MAYERTNQWESMELKALQEFYETKFNETKSFYESKENGRTMNAEDAVDFQTRNAELKAVRERLIPLQEADESYKSHQEFYRKNYQEPANRPPFHGGDPDEGQSVVKTLGQAFAEHEEYKKHVRGSREGIVADLEGVTLKSVEEALLMGGMDVDASIKATMTGASGYPVWSPRLPKVVLTAQRRPVVADLIPQDDTTAPLIIYVEETTFTNAAATVAEGDPKPESTLILEQKESAVKKIATTLPITDEQLDDVPQLRAYVDQRLTLMLQLTEETKLLNGVGTTDILGFLQKSGTGATTRGATEDNPDAILRAIADVNSITAFANASGVVLNPLQWLAIQLLRSTTGDYIWGHPSEKGPKTLWGLPVVETPAIADGKALVGDFRMYSHISRRMGIRIEVGYINEDFKNNIKRLRAEERLSLEIYRANAFNVVSNLNKAA